MADRSRLLSIDALRGFAALYVLLFHVHLYFNVPSRFFSRLFSAGESGVQLFYIISAYTLFYTLANRKPLPPHWKRDFFVRRFFRIAPLFYVSMIIYLLVYGLGPRYSTGGKIGITWDNILATTLFLNGFHPCWIGSIVPVGWSITVEMSFYLLVPLLFTIITSLSRAIIFTVGAIGIALVSAQQLIAHPLIEQQSLWRMFVDHWIVSQIPVFGFGLILFFALPFVSRFLDKKHKLVRSFVGFSFIALALALYVVTIGGQQRSVIMNIISSSIFFLFIIGVTIFPLRLIVNRGSIFLGKISYSFYLMHTVCLHYVINGMAHFHLVSKPSSWNEFLICFALTFIFTVIISVVTFRLIEEPGQRLGKTLLSHV